MSHTPSQKRKPTRKPMRTTLWDVVEALQANLERYGLDDDVVDAAVVCGVETMLDIRQPPGSRRRVAPIGFAPVPIKA